MVVRLIVCLDCHYEGHQKVYTREDLERERLPNVHVRCPRCGSTNVLVKD
jgi:hypothetical protein